MPLSLRGRDPLLPQYRFVGLRRKQYFHHLRGVDGMEPFVRFDGVPVVVPTVCLERIQDRAREFDHVRRAERERARREAFKPVTSFTVAQYISLLAFGFGPDALWFLPLVEIGVAATIVYMALENIVGTNVSRRWALTFAFGLVHGFGFSFALREELQFAGDHLVTSLLAFNLGVEVGQLLVLLVLIPALDLLFKHATGQRLGIIILSALVAYRAWDWMIKRFEQLAQFPAPALDLTFVIGAARGVMAVMVVAEGVVGLKMILSRHRREASGPLPGVARPTEWRRNRQVLVDRDSLPDGG